MELKAARPVCDWVCLALLRPVPSQENPPNKLRLTPERWK